MTEKMKVTQADTVAFVQEWMMSGDHEPDQWHRDFAAAIDARLAHQQTATEDVRDELERLRAKARALEAALWGAYPIVSAELAEAVDSGRVDILATLQPIKDGIDAALDFNDPVFRFAPKSLSDTRKALIQLGDEISQSLVERGHASCGQEAVRIAALHNPQPLSSDEGETKPVTGSLDDGIPNRLDHSKRGFQP